MCVYIRKRRCDLGMSLSLCLADTFWCDMPFLCALFCGIPPSLSSAPPPPPLSASNEGFSYIFRLLFPPASCCSTFQPFFTFTLLPDSSVLLQTDDCSEYRLFALSPVVCDLSLHYQAPTSSNQLAVSARHDTSVNSVKSSLKAVLFSNTFSSVPFP